MQGFIKFLKWVFDKGKFDFEPWVSCLTVVEAPKGKPDWMVVNKEVLWENNQKRVQ